MIVSDLSCEELAKQVREYHIALVRVDALSLMLGTTLAHTRIGWDEDATCESVLEPINQIARQIGDAMPQSIKATRPRCIK